MVNHLYSIVCETIIMDNETKRASYINTIDGGLVSKLPTVMPAFWVGSLWEIEQGNNNLSIRIKRMSPSGKEKPLADLKVKIVAKEKAMHRTNIRLNGLPVEEEGLNLVVVMAKEKDDDEWRKVAELPVGVKKKKEPQMPLEEKKDSANNL